MTTTGYICKVCGAESPCGIGYAGQPDVGIPAADCVNFHVFDGVTVRLDRGVIGWMSDWGAVYSRDWVGRGLVEVVDHNSGGFGGFSYRIKREGKRSA